MITPIPSLSGCSENPNKANLEGFLLGYPSARVKIGFAGITQMGLVLHTVASHHYMVGAAKNEKKTHTPSLLLLYYYKWVINRILYTKGVQRYNINILKHVSGVFYGNPRYQDRTTARL